MRSELAKGQGCRVSLTHDPCRSWRPLRRHHRQRGALAVADFKTHFRTRLTPDTTNFLPVNFLHRTHTLPSHDEISAAPLFAHASATSAPPTPAAAIMSSPRSPRQSTESLDLLSPTPPHTQYPFPIQDEWKIRPSSTGGRYQPRRGSTASSIHSVGGVLDSGFKNSMGAVREQNQNGRTTQQQIYVPEGAC